MLQYYSSTIIHPAHPVPYLVKPIGLALGTLFDKQRKEKIPNRFPGWGFF
jgi:hypothetical protein